MSMPLYIHTFVFVPITSWLQEREILPATDEYTPVTKWIQKYRVCTVDSSTVE